MYVNSIESIWIAVNAVASILTLFALQEAIVDEDAVKKLNGKAREIAASSIVRREAIRFIVQFLLLIIVIPSLFTPGDTPLNASTVPLLCIPIILLISSAYDTRDRKVLTQIILDDLAKKKEGNGGH